MGVGVGLSTNVEGSNGLAHLVEHLIATENLELTALTEHEQKQLAMEGKNNFAYFSARKGIFGAETWFWKTTYFLKM